MRWEKIGVIAEVISAIAVVISVLYLAGQVRESNALAEAESVHAVSTGFTELQMAFATSAELPDIYRTVQRRVVSSTRKNACASWPFCGPISAGSKMRTGEVKR